MRRYFLGRVVTLTVVARATVIRAFLTCAIVFGSAAVAVCVSAGEAELNKQIAIEIDRYGQQGLQLAGGAIVDPIAAGADKAIAVTLRGDWPYAFVAICDAPCQHVELAVRIRSGQLIASTPDAAASVSLEGAVPTDGEYEIQLTVRDCAAARCGLAFAILERPAQSREGTAMAKQQEAHAEALAWVISENEVATLRKAQRSATSNEAVDTTADTAPGKPIGFGR